MPFLSVVFWIALIIFCLVCLGLYVDKKCAEKIKSGSSAIVSLNRLNEKYQFKNVENLDMSHTYDNPNFYAEISTEDYLIYQLSHIGNKAKRSIQDAKYNHRIYEEYVQEIQHIDDFGNFGDNISKCIRWYFCKKEKKIFKSLIQKPTLDFSIKVRLVLAKLNGQILDIDVSVYIAEQIEEIIKALSNQKNGFYLDERIWGAICRVERGKVSNKMRFAVYSRDGNKCRKCGAKTNLEVDHIFPIAKGGKTAFDNLQTLCHNCNAKKSDSIELDAIFPNMANNETVCPNCGASLVVRKGKYGWFLGCSNYPRCKYTKKFK